jgi:cold-inducible RNA-binding protein
LRDQSARLGYSREKSFPICELIGQEFAYTSKFVTNRLPQGVFDLLCQSHSFRRGNQRPLLVLSLKEALMGKKLYVGNLSYDVTNDALHEMFAAYGNVQSAQIVMDRDTGRSKGFGFVEMSNDQEAQAAINGLNGKEAGGRSLTVNEARPREDRGGRGGFGGGGGRSGGGGGGGRGGRGGYGGGRY